MKQLIIKGTEIILQNYEKGQGKIIVSDSFRGSYSYYWGAMGGTIEVFLQKINSDYFAHNLCSETCVFSGKNTAYAIRKHIRKEMLYELPWYKYMEGQKELRKLIKGIESVDDKHEALNMIENFHRDLDLIIMPYNEEQEFLKIIEEAFTCEPWHFLETEPSPQYRFLYNLHKDLVKELKKKS